MFIYIIFLIIHVRYITQDLPFSVWLISLSVILSRSSHLAANVKFHFFYGKAIYIYMYIIHIANYLSIHPMMGTWPWYTVMLWTLEHVYLFELVFSFFSRYKSRRGIAGLHNSSIFPFLRNLHTIFYTGCTDHLCCHLQCLKVPFYSHPLLTSVICRLFDGNHLITLFS